MSRIFSICTQSLPEVQVWPQKIFLQKIVQDFRNADFLLIPFVDVGSKIFRELSYTNFELFRFYTFCNVLVTFFGHILNPCEQIWNHHKILHFLKFWINLKLWIIKFLGIFCSGPIITFCEFCMHMFTKWDGTFNNIVQKVKVIFCKYHSISIWIPSTFENWRPLVLYQCIYTRIWGYL